MQSVDLRPKEKIILRFSGEEGVVSFISSCVNFHFEKVAIEKGYISSIFGYKNTAGETFVQIYISLSNPEIRRKPRGRTTRRVVLEKEHIVKLADSFVRWESGIERKIYIRAQASSVMCIIMREFIYEVLRNFLELNHLQLELKNIRNYPDRKFETMDFEIF